MPGFVLDSSMIAAWLLPDESNFEAVALLIRFGEVGAVAPRLVIYEVRNLLIMSVRRGRIDQELCKNLLSRFHALGVNYTEPDEEEIIALSLKHGLTAYDATFLALAQQTNLPLAAFDTKLRNAAKTESVALLPETV